MARLRSRQAEDRALSFLFANQGEAGAHRSVAAQHNGMELGMARTTPLADIRNIGIIAHVDAGKTTTTERILYYTGRKHTIVDIHDTKDLKTSTTTDYLEQEQKRGITIQTRRRLDLLARQEDQRHRHPRPRGLHHRSEPFACASSTARSWCSTASPAWSPSPRPTGVWPIITTCRACATSTRWTAAAPISRRCVEMIKTRLGARPLVVQLPLGSEDNFRGMVDLVEMKALVWFSDDKDAQWESWEVTDDLADQAEHHRGGRSGRPGPGRRTCAPS